MMSHGRVLLAAFLALLPASAGRTSEPDMELGMIVWLDQIDRQAPPELRVSQYYEVFDIDFAQGPITGRVQLQALKRWNGRGEERVLDSPSGDWTRHLSARLFRNELEVVPAEYEIRFAPTQGRGQNDGKGPVVVRRVRPVEATFTLSGPDGASLEPGTYRLWIMLDMRNLPPAPPGVFRGFAVDDAGAYYLHEPDPARKGGLVFTVRTVGDDPQLMARYLAQRAVLEAAQAFKPENREPQNQEVAIAHRRKAIELALKGLERAPRDVDLLAIVARNHVMLNECDAALPYFKAVWAIDPDYFKHNQNMWMLSCMNSETVAPEPR